MTRPFAKATDAHLFLDATSNHPEHVWRGIAKGLFIRLKRLASTKAIFDASAKDATQWLQKRGYPDDLIKKARRVVSAIPREDLLKRKGGKKKHPPDCVPLVWYHGKGFSPSLDEPPRNLRAHSVDTLKTPQMVVRRTGANLLKLLIRARPSTPSSPGCRRCQGDGCPICECMSETRFVSGEGSKRWRIPSGSTCETKHAVYATACTHCNMWYVGKPTA